MYGEHDVMDEATNKRPTTRAEGLDRVQIPLPSFWPQNPVAFTQVEAIFELRRVTLQRARFLHTVSALSTEVVEEFQDVVNGLHDTTYHDHFTTT